MLISGFVELSVIFKRLSLISKEVAFDGFGNVNVKCGEFTVRFTVKLFKGQMKSLI